MATPFVAEIRLFPYNFAPSGWAFCNGQIMAISQNTALFSLLGTTYGGNGQSTFALPDLRGAVATHAGQGPGLSAYTLGQTGGVEFVTLLESEIPAHTHSLVASQADALNQSPANELLATTIGLKAYNDSTPDVALAPAALAVAGAGLPHNNMQPTLVLHYCIALQGGFPPR